MGHLARERILGVDPDADLTPTADNLGQEALWSIDMRSGKPTLLQAQGQVTDFSVGPQSVVYGLASLTGPVDLYSIHLGCGRPQRLTHFNALAYVLCRRQADARPAARPAFN